MRFRIDLRGLINFGNMAGGYFVATLINNLIPFLVLPILTRFLSPAEYGNLALFTFYLALSNALSGASTPSIISKYFFDNNKEFISRLIGNSIGVIFSFSFLTMLIILVFYPSLSRFLELDLLWMLIIPFASFCWIVFNIGLTVLRNTHKVLLFTKHQVGNTIINFSLSIFFIVFLLWGWQGRILGIIISFGVSAFIMVLYLNTQGYLRLNYSKFFIRKILGFVLPLIPNSFQSVIISQAGIFFIQLYFGKDLLGVYSIGFQIAFSIYLLFSALELSWSPFLYEQLANQKKINRMYLTRMFYVLIGVVVLGILFVNLFSGLILRLMTTPEYYKANEFIPWLTLGFLFFGLYTFLMPVLIKFEKQKFISLVSFINMFVMIGLNIWFADIFGYMGIVYAYCLTYFIMFLIFAWKAQMVFPLPWLRALKIWQ